MCLGGYQNNVSVPLSEVYDHHWIVVQAVRCHCRCCCTATFIATATAVATWTTAGTATATRHHNVTATVAVTEQSHENALCGAEYVVGIGAESRNTATAYPNGYGYYVGTSARENLWGANIHLLRTVDLAGDVNTAAKECNECYYADTKVRTYVLEYARVYGVCTAVFVAVIHQPAL